MPLRPCLDCRRPTDGNRCATCSSKRNAHRDAERGTAAQRGYDAQHQGERAEWVPIVKAGGVTCRRAPFGLCVAPSPLIHPSDDTWHLGHPDAACGAPKAPEHRQCNAGAPRRR